MNSPLYHFWRATAGSITFKHAKHLVWVEWVVDPQYDAALRELRSKTLGRESARPAPDRLKEPTKTNSPAQTRALRRVGRHLGFVKCGHCGERQLFESWEPGWVGWKRWCYVCGAKDEETRGLPLGEAMEVVGAARATGGGGLAGLSSRQLKELLEKALRKREMYGKM